MIDLHSHTNCSDGELTPRELVELAQRRGLSAFAITDHDTLEGYDDAAPRAKQAGIELICGVELNARIRGRTIHILGYFLGGPPAGSFRENLARAQTTRRDRNRRLAGRLRELGLEVRLEEAEKIGRGQTGRPHFARVLVEKGYVADIREAFDRYLDESAPGYVERRDPSTETLLGWIQDAGGISSWAHPGRFLRGAQHSPDDVVQELAAKGLHALEVYHSDHRDRDVELLRAAAAKHGLGITGGSDYHATNHPGIPLGGLGLPDSLLSDLRALSEQIHNRSGIAPEPADGGDPAATVRKTSEPESAPPAIPCAGEN